jgi:sterol desaturase/sphingolipid hydroxylase (fatty acid hydroxylase superfamily)
LQAGTTNGIERKNMSIILDTLGAAIIEPARLLMNAQSLFNIYSAASALFLGLIYYFFKSKQPALSIHKLQRIFFPKSVFLHPSALFDYQYFIFSRIFFFLFYAIIAIPSNETISEFVVTGITKLFGSPSNEPLQSSWASLTTETVTYVIAFDLGYWLHHWAFHRFTWLWEFHKPHHSAQVLNIFTSIRAHPLEEFLTAILIAVTTSLVHGIFLYLNGTSAYYAQIGGHNVLMLIFYMTFYHLRHTQIWLPVTGFWGHVIQSPAHHQLHHSTNPRHYNKNFGFCLSLWDWVFGTLYIPEKHEKLTFGIGEEGTKYNKLIPYLFLPIINNYRRITKTRPTKSTISSL